MTETAQGRLGRRLRRILLLLPYAIRHPGVHIDELSRRFGVNKQDLIDDLHLVFVCGLPSYTPADLIEVSIENDRVFVDMADYFETPLRLTPVEALVLHAGGSAIAALPGMEEADALRRALRKLGGALGGNGDRRGIQVQLEPGAPAHLETLQRALSKDKRVRLVYFSASRGELTERAVDPWGLIAALGRWYLVGWDHLSGDERLFRTDRIKSVEVMDDPANVPDDFNPERYRGAFVARGGAATVSLEISPGAARWFDDYYPTQKAETLDDGWRAVELQSSGVRWAATLVLRLGRDVRAVRPIAVLDEAKRLAGSVAARHGAAPAST